MTNSHIFSQPPSSNKIEEVYRIFNLHIIKRLRDDVSFEQPKDYKKYFILLFDEIKIKSGLVSSKLSNKLIGFTELGNIYEELNQFERTVSEHLMKTFRNNIENFHEHKTTRNLMVSMKYKYKVLFF